MDRADLRVSVAHDGGDTVVALAGQLDLSTVGKLSETVHEVLTHKPSRIVVDLADLSFCDSLGLGTLVVLSRAARARSTYLTLRNPSAFFTRMLEVTGLHEGLSVSTAPDPSNGVRPEAR